MQDTPDDQYVSELQQVEFQPVFILGVHRSGTSILYKMLSETDSFNPVTAYHLINYHELLVNHHQNTEEHARQQLTESMKAQGLQDRKIDQLKVTADFAEEYGFLLNERTMRMYLSPKNIPLFTEMCKKIQSITGNTKPLLLKNPYDFPNFLYIKRMFPNAKFVFIHRHPLKTISSTLKAFQMIFQDKHPYMVRLSRMYEKFHANPLLLFPFRLIFSHVPELGVIYITRTTAKATNYYLKYIEKLSQEDYVAITYEEFCQHPQNIIEDIMHRLSVKMDTPVNTAALMKPRKVEVDGTVQKFLPYIYRSMKKYYDTFGYHMKGE
jgi:Sulfotransferase family